MRYADELIISRFNFEVPIEAGKEYTYFPPIADSWHSIVQTEQKMSISMFSTTYRLHCLKWNFFIYYKVFKAETLSPHF